MPLALPGPRGPEPQQGGKVKPGLAGAGHGLVPCRRKTTEVDRQSCLLLCNKSPHKLEPNTSMCYVTASGGQEPGAASSAASAWGYVRGCPRPVITKAPRGQDPRTSSPSGGWQDSVPPGVSDWGPRPVLLSGWRPPSALCYLASAEGARAGRRGGRQPFL